MGIIRAILSLTAVFAVMGCPTRPDGHKNKPEMRRYRVEGEGSLQYDTLYRGRGIENSLSILIYGIDSVLSEAVKDFAVYGADVSIEGVEFWKEGGELVRYSVSMPVEEGILSFYGIYGENVGTVYWRWLDGYRELILEERILGDSSYVCGELCDYIIVEVLPLPSVPDYMWEEGDEIDGSLEINDSLLR